MKEPNKKPKSFQVTRGNVSITVYPHGKGWRFAWRLNGETEWKYVTRKSKVAATDAAENKIDQICSDGLVWASLSAARRRFLEAIHREAREEDQDALTAYLKGRQKSAEIVESANRYFDWKIAQAGEKTPHIRNIKAHIETMAIHFKGKTVTDISADQLADFWKERWGHLSWKSRKDARGSFIGFWNWCILMGLYPKDVTPAERIPPVKSEKCERRVLTPNEFFALARAIQPQFRGTIVLQGLCGFRPEEVSPPHRKGMSKKFKRGIFREEFDWEYNVIRVPDPVAKTGYSRIVPILPGVSEWLEWAGIRPNQTGTVCDNMVLAGETARLGIEVFKTGWPKDALRHSYGSYRNAIIRSLDQVAEEMGSSVAMLRKHYHNPRAREEGEAWFEMRPSDL
jgi:hypothetical protein